MKRYPQQIYARLISILAFRRLPVVRLHIRKVFSAHFPQGLFINCKGRREAVDQFHLFCWFFLQKQSCSFPSLNANSFLWLFSTESCNYDWETAPVSYTFSFLLLGYKHLLECVFWRAYCRNVKSDFIFIARHLLLGGVRHPLSSGKQGKTLGRASGEGQTCNRCHVWRTDQQNHNI